MSGSRVSGSWVSGLKVPGPGSQVLILDYAYKKVYKKLFYGTNIYVCENSVFCFISLVFDWQLNTKISSLLKRFFKFLMFSFYF